MNIGGADLMDQVWNEVVEFIPKNRQEDVALKVVNIFIDADVDGLEDTDHAILRKAYGLINDEDVSDDE